MIFPRVGSHKFHAGKVGDKVIGGWYTSGILTAQTGVPIKVTEGSQVWGGGTSMIGATDYMLPTGPLPSTGVNRGVAASTCSNSLFNTTVGQFGIQHRPGNLHQSRSGLLRLQLRAALLFGTYRERQSDVWPAVLEFRYAGW